MPRFKSLIILSPLLLLIGVIVPLATFLRPSTLSTYDTKKSPVFMVTDPENRVAPAGTVVTLQGFLFRPTTTYVIEILPISCFGSSSDAAISNLVGHSAVKVQTGQLGFLAVYFTIPTNVPEGLQYIKIFPQGSPGSGTSLGGTSFMVTSPQGLQYFESNSQAIEIPFVVTSSHSTKCP